MWPWRAASRAHGLRWSVSTPRSRSRARGTHCEGRGRARAGAASANCIFIYRPRRAFPVDRERRPRKNSQELLNTTGQGAGTRKRLANAITSYRLTFHQPSRLTSQIRLHWADLIRDAARHRRERCQPSGVEITTHVCARAAGVSTPQADTHDMLPRVMHDRATLA